MKWMQIVIPTHARPDRQITLSNLPVDLRDRTLVVVSTEQDARAINENYSHPASRIQVVPRTVDCIAKKRHWIMQNVKAENIFMMDDDINFFVRCAMKHRYWSDTKHAWQLHDPAGSIRLSRKANANDMFDCFDALEKKFQTFHAVGIGHRRHNDKIKDTWMYNTRMMFMFGINRETYRKMGLNFGDVRCREDFHITLELLKAGHGNAVYTQFYGNPGSFGAPGGASTERSLEQSDREAVRLARLHPGLVRVVDRAYVGGASTPRKEVVIGWKKAYNGGKQHGTT